MRVRVILRTDVEIPDHYAPLSVVGHETKELWSRLYEASEDVVHQGLAEILRFDPLPAA